MTRFQKRLGFTLSIPTYVLATLFVAAYFDAPLIIGIVPLTGIIAFLWAISGDFIKR